jgi:hypothetical protein
MRLAALAVLIFASGCTTKTICANGTESFRPVLDSANSCAVRIRQVIVGTDIKTPPSVAIDGGSVNWTYGWTGSEFKNGQIELGHVILKPGPATTEVEKK